MGEHLLHQEIEHRAYFIWLHTGNSDEKKNYYQALEQLTQSREKQHSVRRKKRKRQYETNEELTSNPHMYYVSSSGSSEYSMD